MDLNGIRSELRRLTELTAEWQARGGADELERDVALGMLRRIYEAIRFQESVPEAARPTESAVEVPVTLDLDGILDPSAAFSDADPLAEPQRPGGAGRRRCRSRHFRSRGKPKRPAGRRTGRSSPVRQRRKRGA